MSKVRVACDVDPKEAKEIEKRATKEDLSIAQWVRRAIRKALTGTK